MHTIKYLWSSHMEKMDEILEDICVRKSKWIDDDDDAERSGKINLMIESFCPNSEAHVSMVKMLADTLFEN